jgi:hypothetical protein
MVEGLQRAWSRTGITGSLEDRWNSAVERLRKLSPNASVGGPRSEIGLDQIEVEIARLTKPVDANDPALRAASEEMNNTEQRYHRAWCDARDLIQKLQRSAIRRSPEHQLLGDLPDDLFLDVGPPIDQSSHPWPRFRSAREARVAVAALLPAVLTLEARNARLRRAR